MGLIQTPTADNNPEGTLAFTLNNNPIWKIGTLTASPFDWLEASYFYYRPSDLRWEGNLKRGDYLDKGFNVKMILRPNIFRTNFAIGLDDLAGTGYFSREYIVATTKLEKINFSYGIGWGKFTGENSFKNPFEFLSPRFLTRQPGYDAGGELAYNRWFRGDASMFGGFELFIPRSKGIKLKVEYDPFNYFDFTAQNRGDALKSLRKKESKLNIGVSFPVNEYITLESSYFKGNSFNLSFNVAINFNKSHSNKPKFAPIISKEKLSRNPKEDFYINLLNNLNRNRLLLQTANLDENKLDISISTSDHRNSVRSSSYAGYIAKKVLDNHEINVSRINISHINTGIELNDISYISSNLSDNDFIPIEYKKSVTKLDSGNKNSYKKHEFQPNVAFPVIFTDLSAILTSHIGNPEKFYFGGAAIQHISEIQFRRNLLMTSDIKLSLFNNFTDTISGPGSKMEHVRTDLVQYLKKSDLYISRLQFDYFFTPKKNVYAKFSAGIFEMMYAGFGGEILYKPFNSNFALGIDAFEVKQRDFDQKFGFREYETFTGHISLSYLFKNGIESKISYGRYLAKDDGYTLDLSKRSKSGFKSGFYFTRTDVPASLFGEGSFDKGIYFQIPLDLFTGKYNGNYSSFKLSPLTRDGGAKLQYEKDLRGIIYNSSYYEIYKDWGGFLD